MYNTSDDGEHEGDWWQQMKTNGNIQHKRRMKMNGNTMSDGGEQLAASD